MNLIAVVRSVLTGQQPRWNPDEDALVQYLREQRRAALLAARRLHHQDDDFFPIADMVQKPNGHDGTPRKQQ